MATDHGHDRPAPGHSAPAAQVEKPSATANVVSAVKSAHSGYGKIKEALPYVADAAMLLFDVIGMAKLSKQIADLKRPVQASATGPATGAQAQITDAPFGLTGLSLQDEAQMKERWDMVLFEFQSGDAAQRDFPYNFSKLSRQVLKTYPKQSMLRNIVVRNRDLASSVKGLCAMVRECQTKERFELYCYQNGILTESTDSELAWVEAKAQRATTTDASLDLQISAKRDAWNRLDGWQKTLVRLGLKRL